MSENKTAEETVKNSEHDTNPPIILNKQQWQCVYNWMQEYSNQQNQELQRQVEELKEKEIIGDRRLVVLEHDKVVIKSQYTQLKEAADEICSRLEKLYKELMNHIK